MMEYKWGERERERERERESTSVTTWRSEDSRNNHLTLITRERINV
jgi:hypothetical protein